MDLDSITAHHEAAHAVVNYRAGGKADDTISIVPNAEKGSLGHASDGTSDSLSADHMEARILSCYAGGHAQRRCDPTQGADGCEVDDELAEDILTEWGWTDREQEFRDRARALVEKHWPEIEAVAAELCRVRTLDWIEVEWIADAASGLVEFLYGSLAADLAQYRVNREAARRRGRDRMRGNMKTRKRTVGTRKRPERP